MAHKEQQDFCLGVKESYPNFFSNKKVLDVGSLDINGNNRFLFKECDVTGIDVGKGKNVDIVSLAHEFNAPSNSYDVIISTECLEHDMFYKESLGNMMRILKPGGLLLFTCASTNRPEHGTSKHSPHDSPLTSWDYYRNLEEQHIREVLDLEKEFSEYKIFQNPSRTDLYFWGIKKNIIKFIVPIPDSSYYIQQALIQINNFAKYGYDSETHYLVGIIYEKVNPHIVKIAESGLTKAHFHFYKDGRTIEERRYSASLKPHLMYRYFKEFPEEYKHAYVYLDPDLIFMEKFDFTPFLNDNHWYGSDTASYMNTNYIKSKGEGLLEDMCNFVGIDPAIVIANDNSIIGAQYVTKNNTAEFWESVYKKSSQAYIYLSSIQAKYFKPEMTYWLQIWCTEMWITVWECWKRGLETKAHKDFEFHWANHNAKDRKHKMFHNAGIPEQDQSKTTHYAKRAYEHVTPFNRDLPVSEESLSMEYVKEIKETEKNYPTLIW